MSDPSATDGELVWRRSSFSADAGSYVEIADTGDGILLRHSDRPDEAPIAYTRAELEAWIAGCKAGEFDDLG
ncbi:MAG: DUF397 domain-containing protein [Actinomycetota bacterium]